MFNFHKPRTYRSTEGCCICKAKSSSSRFIDSRKYERDTMQCFDLKYPRQGEICNACVLLVKRFKRLPVGSKRNWSHIVDAKAGIGPGYNKIQTKYKSERINTKTGVQQTQGNISVLIPENNNNTTANSSGSSPLNSLCFVPEKFSKIFKKSKKIKDTSHNSRRKSANNGWSQNNIHCLPTTPDSLDSDYEDTRLHASLSGNTGGSTVVQFQTQTRASAHKAQAAAEARKKIIKLGTKRRKCLVPRKNFRSIIYEETLQFFDEEEWREHKSCCGMMYECSALGGALLIDTANYKPCEQHQQRRLTTGQEKEEKLTTIAASCINNDKKINALSLPKSIIQTMPAVVQLQPAQVPPLSSSVLSSSSSSLVHSYCSTTSKNSYKTATAVTTIPTIPTPVLKKHHLFFKRQSECFPQGDIVATSNNTNNDTNSTLSYVGNKIKAESQQHQNQFHHNHQQQLHLQQQLQQQVHQNQQQQQQQQSSSTTLQRHIENAIHSNSFSNPSATILTDSLTSLPLSISVTSTLSSSLTASSSTAIITSMPQMPKHSLAKVTNISPTLTASIHPTHHSHNTNGNSNLALAKPNGYLHKIKSDSGKIAKHSLDKFNTAVKIKPNDINEIKPIIRTVDKSYIVAKSPTQTTATTAAAYHSLGSYNGAGQPPLTTTSLSAASPTSSTSSTSSNKFSDNSSDSGFDENMLDRKSASPLQEDCEKKMLSRPGVHTMFLASGVQIQGQPQNLVLTGNEVAAKILQNRKYSNITTSHNTTNARSLTTCHHPTTTAVKIAQISATPQSSSPSSSSAMSNVGPPIAMSSAAQAKMRAIYNNNNTIQHENGITTIVPASSLAASTQTAAMQNIAPSSVTITPAPPVGTQFNSQNIMSRKLATANIINLQSNTTNLSNSHNNTIGNHHHNLSNSSSNNTPNNNNTNQKIILLKTSNNTTTVTATSNYTHTLTGGGGGGLGNGGCAR